MPDPVVRYIAWAPHSRTAFAAETEAAAKRAARDYAARYGDVLRWPAMQREGWRVSKVGGEDA